MFASGEGKPVVLSWVPDWSWGLPLLVLTVVVHVSAIFWTAKMLGRYRRTAANKASYFVIFVAFVALASAVYLAIEAAAWAVLSLAWRFGRLGASNALFARSDH